MSAPLFEFLLRLGDDRLILGHRNAEWCGHGPILEEDIAITNIALDLTGAAQLLLDLAGRVEGQGRDADALAYWRDETQFRNLQMVELPRGDFAFTMVRQLFFSAWTHFLFEWLKQAAHEELAGIAAKAQKENRYHLRHAGEWVVRLGDGTEESHRRAQEAVETLWPWTDEMFATDAVDQAVEAELGLPVRPDLKAEWRAVVTDVLDRARLTIPETPMRMTGGRKGRHTESLGRLLAEMQIVARSHPGAAW